MQWVVGTRFLHYLDHSGVQQGGGVLAKAKNSNRESSMFKDSDAANPIQLHNCIKYTSWTTWSKYDINFATKMPLFVT